MDRQIGNNYYKNQISKLAKEQIRIANKFSSNSIFINPKIKASLEQAKKARAQLLKQLEEARVPMIGFNEEINELIKETLRLTQHSPFILRRKLGDKSWVLPLEVKRLSYLIESEDLDKEIESLYYLDDRKILDDLIETIGTSKYIDSKEGLFNESIKAYELGLFHVSGVALSTMIESVLEDDNNKANIKLFKLFKALMMRFGNLILKEPNAQLVFALQGFMNNYTKSINFNKSEPEFINRHWIMHGRMKKPITKANCLQLISALSAIVELLDAEIENYDEISD